MSKLTNKQKIKALELLIERMMISLQDDYFPEDDDGACFLHSAMEAHRGDVYKWLASREGRFLLTPKGAPKPGLVLSITPRRPTT